MQRKRRWISIFHIPGIDNEIEDKASRVFNDQTEWNLDENIFSRTTNILGVPDVDMFASRLNCQVLPYVAWRPDPQAIAIDAFTINWSDYSLIYALPPFSMIPLVLQKIQMETITKTLPYHKQCVGRERLGRVKQTFSIRNKQFVLQ